MCSYSRPRGNCPAKRQVRDALSEQARALRDAANKFLLENDPLGAGEKTE
jgi:hypothetical protein